MRHRPRPEPTATELALLQQLWSHGTCTIRELCEALYRGGGASEYATVQKLLERLEAKGLVARDRAGRAHVFRATEEPAAFVGERLRDLAQRLCGGSLAPLLTHLVRSGPLSAAERRELRALLDEPRDRKRSGR